MLSHLDDQQKADFEQANHIYLTGSAGGHFEIVLGRAHNIFAVDENKRRVTCYCAHVTDPIPDEDNMLAQMLHIRSNEREFIRFANASTPAR